MPTITVRELARKTAAVIHEVESSGRPALVTRNGRPVAALVAVDEAALEAWLLSQAPEFTRSAANGDVDHSGEPTHTDDWPAPRPPATERRRATSEVPPEHLRGSHRGV